MRLSFLYKGKKFIPYHKTGISAFSIFNHQNIINQGFADPDYHGPPPRHHKAALPTVTK